MKNRGFFLSLVIIFTAICLYNIFWTVERISIDADLNASTVAQRSEYLKDEDKRDYYAWAQKNSLSLGLDLQGGMFITLEVGIDEVLKGLTDNPTNPTFVKALELARKKQLTRQDGFIDLFIESVRELDANAKLSSFFAGSKLGLSYTASDGDVAQKLNEEVQIAFENSLQVIRTRIDQFGVAAANIQAVPSTGRILVELPGVKDAERVRKLLRGTAELGFWPCKTGVEVFSNSLVPINEKIRVLKGLATDTTQTDSSATVATADTTATDTTQSLTEALGDSAKTDAEGNQSQDEQRKKFERENPFFAVLTPPSQDQFTSQSTSPVVGYALPTDTAQVNAYLRLPEVRPLLPADVKLLWTAKPDSPDSPYLTLIAIANTRDGVAPLTGDAIVDTKQDFDPDNNQPIVSMSMNVDGAKIWRKMTGDNKGRSVAVVLDNLVYTYPTVNQEIPNGQSVISGNFTVEEAADLANVLKAGKLRAPVRIEGGEIVGPSLGVQTTERGLISFVLGFLAVVGFMVAYYRGSGVVASLALVLNLVFIVGVSAAFNIAMTLPGIAGIILSLAMAVDANVLIYERIREELEAGRSFRPAIAAGFKNALSSIIDGNVTTLITAIILTWVGQGPVRGFGVTLIIGILTSMVSAVIITRMMLDYRSSKSEKTNLSFGVAGATRFFKRSGLNLVGARKRNYALLVGLCLAVAVCIGGFGFKLGVDFLGGRQYLVEFADAPKDLDVVRADLKAAFEGNEPVVKTIGASQQLLITTAYLQEQPDADEQVETKLLAGLSVHFAAQQPTILRRTTIGPTVARDIRDSAFKAVALSLLGIFLYIFIRFRRWQFGVSAVISLAFNVLIVLGLFSLLGALNVQFSVEIDQVFIAAVLTIVGYTINDTVVVFDRIRENLDEHRSSSSLAELYRRALNDTLSRTVITATSVLLTSAIMFFIAGTVLQGFMLAIFMGIIIGTFSTLFLASPLSLDLLVRFSGLSKPKQALATS